MTNHSIQEEHPKFGSFEANNELFFDEFAKKLESEGVDFYK